MIDNMEYPIELAAKVEFLQKHWPNTLSTALAIEFESIALDKVIARMPVDQRTKQPFGILHGGASVALAESVASIGAWVNVDETRFLVVGLEINANHIKAVRDGIVRAVATPLHKGGRTHVWTVEIRNEQSQLVCVSRCTLAVIEKR